MNLIEETNREITLDALVACLDNKPDARRFISELMYHSSKELSQFVVPMAVRLIDLGHNVDRDQLLVYCSDRLHILLALEQYNSKHIDAQMEYMVAMLTIYIELYHD